MKFIAAIAANTSYALIINHITSGIKQILLPFYYRYCRISSHKTTNFAPWGNFTQRGWVKLPYGTGKKLHRERL